VGRVGELGSEGSEAELIVEGVESLAWEGTAILAFSSRISLLYGETRERREVLTFDWKILTPPDFPHSSDLP